MSGPENRFFMPDENSVTYWIQQLQAGAQGAAEQEVWNRYYERLIEELSDNSPTPELAAEAAEQARLLLAILDKDSHRRVAELKLAGYTNHEIAQQLGVIERTVERRLTLIRVRWADYGDAVS